MDILKKASASFLLGLTLTIAQLYGVEVRAQSSYFTTLGCTSCHGTTATCNGCHAHGTHSSSAKSGINIAGTTNKTVYAPGETVSVTITGGYRTGWVRAMLLDQNKVELARSTGVDSGMGSSTTFPAVLTAKAPLTAGTYTWKVAWYGNQYDTGSATFGTQWVSDPDNPNHGMEIANLPSFTVGAASDTTAPVIASFTIPATATSLTVPVTALSATDNVAVTGYQVTASATAPAATAAGWTATAPASVTATAAGSRTFYAWAKDAAGNVSLAKSATVVITLPDTTAPVVGTFTLPATATSLTVPVSALTATDNVAVTGYQVTASATAPAATAAGWTATAPASVTATAAGSRTFYAWAKDAAGNVSLAKSATVVITLPDTTAPVVGTFNLPATATSLTVPVSALSATDNVAVTGYLVTASATAPAAGAVGWTATAPASVSATAAGTNTFYAWAKDAAGNVSVAKSATVVVTLPDSTAPSVTSFTLPATATALTVPVSTLAATDNVAVTGYLVTASATAPVASATGWSATAPVSVTAAAAGSITFYAWAKDAAGNVSLAKSATVLITLPDTTAPLVGTFTLPATATSLIVPLSALSATDNVAVTGYLVTASATAPAATAAGWTATAPASVTAGAAGSNTFYAWAKDAAGNVSVAKSATVVITLPDTTAPVVATFTLPATATSLTVPLSALSATDNVAVTGYLVTANATAPAATAAGWTATAPASVTAAAAGSNTFYAWAKDAAGNVSAAKSATVVIAAANGDTVKPELSVSTLEDGAYTNKVTLNVSGIATDAGGLKSVTVNGSPVEVNAADGSFSTAVALSVGGNTLTIVAVDNAGNEQQVTRTIKYDPAAPVLAVSSPADNSTFDQSLLTLKGTVNESATVAVKLNNGAPQYANVSGTSFSAAVYLVEGINTIDITATDLAGNTTSSKRTVTYTKKQISLAITHPSQDITTKYPYVVLRGTVSNTGSALTVRVSVNGKIFTPRLYANGVFIQRIPFPAAGLYKIVVIAKDAAGNSTRAVRNVIYRPVRSDDDHDDD